MGCEFVTRDTQVFFKNTRVEPLNRIPFFEIAAVPYIIHYLRIMVGTSEIYV
jgi:hypothetical protein